MNVNAHAARGAGLFRDPWGIRKFLSLRGTNMRQIAKEMGKHPQQVQETVRGIRNDREVLARLRDMGCPEEYLSLPKDMVV